MIASLTLEPVAPSAHERPTGHGLRSDVARALRMCGVPAVGREFVADDTFRAWRGEEASTRRPSASAWTSEVTAYGGSLQ